MKSLFTSIFSILIIGFLLAGCSSSFDSKTSSSTASSTLSGRVSLAPLQNATITIYKLNADGSRGASIASTTSDSSGDYTVSVPANSGAVIVVASGGTYTEEATGTPTSLGANEITAVLANVSADRVASVTPLTHIAASRALAQIANGTSADLAAGSANAAVALAAGLPTGTDVTAIKPADPNLTLASQGLAADSAEAKYGLFLAGLSQWGNDNGAIDSVKAMNAFAQDFAADGALDGKDGNGFISVSGGPTLTNTSWSGSVYQGESDFLAGAHNTANFTAPSLAVPVAHQPSQGHAVLDSTFGGGVGYVTHKLAPYYKIYNAIQAMSQQADGKIVACGNINTGSLAVPGPYLIRTNTDGTIDSTFGHSGVVAVDASKLPIFLQPTPRCVDVKVLSNGQIMMLISDGYISGSNGPTFLYSGTPRLIKFNSDGSYDTSFGNQGLAVSTLADHFDAFFLQPVSDGGFVVGGRETLGPAVMKFTASGGVDTSFGTQGATLWVDHSNILFRIRFLSLDQYGKIYLGTSYNNHGLVIRYNVDGSFDSGFGPSGYASVGIYDNLIPDFQTVDAVLQQSTTALVFIGKKNNSIIAARTNANATGLIVDSSFGTSGYATIDTGFNFAAMKAYLTGSDQIMLAAGYPGAGGYAFMTRLTSDGAVDSGFSTTTALNSIIADNFGSVITPAVGGGFIFSQPTEISFAKIDAAGARLASLSPTGLDYNSLTQTVAHEGGDSPSESRLLPDGKLLIMSDASSIGNATFPTLTKLLADGSVDPSFGTSGRLKLPHGNGGQFAVQSDGQIIVAANYDNTPFNYGDLDIARYSAAGVLDTTFGTAGYVNFTGAVQILASKVIVQADGKILIGGTWSDWNGDNYFFFARLTSSGALDNSFGSGGVLKLPVGSNSSGNYFCSLARFTERPSGEIIAAGFATDNSGAFLPVVTQITSAGAADASFGTAGTTFLNIPGGMDIGSVLVGTDGKTTVIGVKNSDSKLGLARVNSDGSMDSSFGTSGIRLDSYDTSTFYPTDALFDSAGRILISGNFQPSGGLLRLNYDGSLDTTFATSGVYVADWTAGTNYIPVGLHVSSDGAILFTGAIYDNPQRPYTASGIVVMKLWP